ncbi:FtsX-like permease family protein [Atopobacter phocae]|uniref:FtsX-like permease family protein n=1 Tax=Atopobacter phocae TaxID=136492 RepID=UPI000472DBAA|nr:FtsX-like permease family protein [Atopobacter phocae]
MKTYIKSIVRDITFHWGRFLSLILIILLGVAFLVGIRAAGPSMLETANNYYQKQHFADLSIVSPYGIEPEDVQVLNDAGYKTISEVRFDAELVEPKNLLSIRIYDPSANINKVLITEGRAPKERHEILMDQYTRRRIGLNLGDSIQLKTKTVAEQASEEQPQLQEEHFKVVGFGQVPEYIEIHQRGRSRSFEPYNFFAYVTQDAVQSPMDTFAVVDLNTKAPFYDASYKKQVEQAQRKMEQVLKKQGQKRVNVIQSKGRQTIEQKEKQLNQQVEQLQEAKKQVQRAKEQLATVEGQMDQRLFQQQFGAEIKTLNEQEQQLKKQEEQTQPKIEEARQSIETAKKELVDLKTIDYFVLKRDALPGYLEFEDNAYRISAIASIFPVFFFLVATLMSFTSIKRMVDEHRTQIGMYKGLGYSNRQLYRKYGIYALLAVLIGGTIGLFVGYPLFPPLVYGAYASLYNIPNFEVVVQPLDWMLAFGFSVLSTVGSAYYAAHHSLKEVPADLLRPKPPKQGQRILLERWTWLWNRLSFNRKMTLRNLSRYKGRNLMTILGVAGCTALIVTGFGISDSVKHSSERQFNEIISYQGLIRLNDDLSDKAREDIVKELQSDETIQYVIPVHTESANVSPTDRAKQDVQIFVPLADDYKEVLTLQNRQSGDLLDLPQQGALMSEKLRRLLQGANQAEITTENDEVKNISITATVENYLGHYIYFSPESYEKEFKQAPKVNAYLLAYPENETWEKDLSSRLSDTPGVLAFVSLTDVSRAYKDTLDSLDNITIVLIASAALLAFIVLYSLTQINISERQRELSTIKVLGFYNREVSWYIGQELLVLTGLGILFGSILGNGLNRFILNISEVDQMLLPATIQPLSYFYAAALTIVFSVSVLILMHFHLKHVNMVEALKAEE